MMSPVATRSEAFNSKRLVSQFANTLIHPLPDDAPELEVALETTKSQKGLWLRRPSGKTGNSDATRFRHPTDENPVRSRESVGLPESVSCKTITSIDPT